MSSTTTICSRFINEFHEKMKSPITGKEMLLIKESRILTFRKEEFEVVYHHYKCEDSGEFFTTTELDEINLNQLHNQYQVHRTSTGQVPDK